LKENQKVSDYNV